MKEKIKRFFIEKKELLIFIGVVIFVFAAVIGIANLAINSNDTETPPASNEPEDPSTDTEEPNEETPTVTPKFSLPIVGEYKIVRQYFDINSYTKEELEAAVIQGTNGYITSTGIGYATLDDSTFDVIAIYDGTIISVVEDEEVVGSTVTIDHGNGIISIYSSMANVGVTNGAEVKQGDVIGQASTSINDTAAGTHVTLEVMIDNDYVNPNSVIGKQVDEIVDMK